MSRILNEIITLIRDHLLIRTLINTLVGFIVCGGVVDFDMDSLSMEKAMIRNMIEKTGKNLCEMI